MYKRALFGLTRSQQGLKQQKDMLFSAARLHSKLQDQKTTNQVLNLSASKKKKFLRDGMVTQMYELGYKTTFSQKYFTLYRTYVLYEDMYYYFVDKFSREDASMGEIILTITRLADKYLEHEFDKKGYANIFDFLKEKHHIEDMLRDHLLNDYLTDNSENPKDSRPNWMSKADQWEKSLTPEKWQKVIEEHTFEEMEKEDQARKQALMDKIRQSLKMTPEEHKRLIEEHTFEEMEKEEKARKG
jgi:hypothetical protein